MATITITPDNLETQAGELLKFKQQHDDAYKQIDSLVHNLVAEWTGEAQTAFINSFDSKKATFTQFGVDMENFANLMKKAAERMRAADTELKSQMNV